MNTEDIKKLIKEEIKEFEYLNLDSIKEQDSLDATLNSREFQTNLIRDSINGKVNWKLQEDMTSEVEDDGWDGYKIEKLYKDLETIYNFNGRPYKITLFIEGENVPVYTSGRQRAATRMQPAEYPETTGVDYGYTDVNFFDEDGSEINMPWFDKDSKLKNQFVTSILGRIPS